MIVAADVTVTFARGLRRPPLKALDGFSVSVARGDLFGLLGPNGAGKSTALYVFLGLIRPTRGRVRILGREPVPGQALYDRIAYVPEEPHYHLYLTVQEALRYYARLYTADIPAARLDEALERVQLAEFRDLRLDRCSKGMKQKLGLAACLVGRPELVFLDEPTRGLDPVAVKEFRDLMLDMNRQGTTFVINSHILSEVETVCNRVAILNRGRVLMQDDLRHLLHSDPDTYAVEFSPPDGTAAPSWVTAISPLHGIRRGLVPAARLAEFTRWAGTSGVRLLTCSLKRTSLEEAFFNVLRENPPC